MALSASNSPTDDIPPFRGLAHYLSSERGSAENCRKTRNTSEEARNTGKKFSWFLAFLDSLEEVPSVFSVPLRALKKQTRAISTKRTTCPQCEQALKEGEKDVAFRLRLAARIMPIGWLLVFSLVKLPVFLEKPLFSLFSPLIPQKKEAHGHTPWAFCKKGEKDVNFQ